MVNINWKHSLTSGEKQNSKGVFINRQDSNKNYSFSLAVYILLFAQLCVHTFFSFTSAVAFSLKPHNVYSSTSNMTLKCTSKIEKGSKSINIECLFFLLCLYSVSIILV